MSNASPRIQTTLSDSVTTGAYRLLQKLGEGGTGEVWLAEQKEPFRRTVALKLIRGNATVIDGCGGGFS